MTKVLEYDEKVPAGDRCPGSGWPPGSGFFEDRPADVCMGCQRLTWTAKRDLLTRSGLVRSHKVRKGDPNAL